MSLGHSLLASSFWFHCVTPARFCRFAIVVAVAQSSRLQLAQAAFFHQKPTRHPVDVTWNARRCHQQCHECHACHAKRRWMWDCATPAVWNTRQCHQAPRLPRKSAAASQATKTSPSAPPSAISATPATQNEGGCEIAPRLPRKSAAASRATKTSPSAPPSTISATPAMQNEGGCEIAPRLPRKVPRRPGRLKPAQARHPVP